MASMRGVANRRHCSGAAFRGGAPPSRSIAAPTTVRYRSPEHVLHRSGCRPPLLDGGGIGVGAVDVNSLYHVAAARPTRHGCESPQRSPLNPATTDPPRRPRSQTRLFYIWCSKPKQRRLCVSSAVYSYERRSERPTACLSATGISSTASGTFLTIEGSFPAQNWNPTWPFGERLRRITRTH